jgi:myo-inositol catabolism protein IolS
MRYRKLGRTDISVSAICLGCWALIGDDTWGHQDREESLATVRAALDAGISFFDTAPGYGDGDSEELLGRALADVRRDVVIATKVSRGQLAPGDAVRSCERSLRLLKTDVIDLLQVHWPSADVPLAETLGAMERLREAGKVRAIGVSNFGASWLGELRLLGRAETNQVNYSLLFRAVEHEVRPICLEEEIGILCYSPLCQGLLTGKFAGPDDVPDGRARSRLFSKDRPQARHDEPGCEAEAFRAVAEVRRIAASVGRPAGRVALAWVLAQPGVTSAIAGARSPAQVRENALAADLSLDRETLDGLAAATDEVKTRLGPNIDMWQTDSRAERG